MPKPNDPSSIDPAAVDAAIARVLQSEREARDAVAQCTSDAEAIIERAQRQAREIARRAAQRAVRVQRWSADALQHRLAELAYQERQGDREPGEADASQRLKLAAARLAAELTGVGP
jgi:hypothetical protein